MNSPDATRSVTRRAFVAGLALSPFALHPQRATGRRAPPEAKAVVFRYAFGDAKVCVFDSETWTIPISFAASNAPTDEQSDIQDEHGLFTLSVIATLVDTGDHLIVVDAGPDDFLASRMIDAGYEPEDVDLVTFSHLHFDHVNGAFAFGTRSKLAFANARCFISSAEYDYWMHDDGREVSPMARANMARARGEAQAIIRALGDRLETAEWDEEIVPGVKLVQAIGHTGGHSAVEMSSGAETLMHIGDLILNPVLNLEHPEWTIAPAVWPEEDLVSRRVLMNRAAEGHMIVQTVHFPFPGVGYVEKDGDAWRWLPLNGSANPAATP